MSARTSVHATRVPYVVALIGLVVVLDTTIMAIATATLAEELDVGLPAIQWVTTGYTLALVAVIPMSAWLIARHGAYRTYVAAVATFAVASMLCATAWDVGSLVAFRVLQGLGGGLIVPVGTTIALSTTPHARRGRTMAVLGLPVLVGPVLGPTLGGWLVDHGSWRAIFCVNLPVAILGLVLAARTLPRDTPTGRRPLDRLGLLTLSPGAALLVLGLSEAGRRSRLVDPTVLSAVAAGACLVVGHLLRSRHRATPLVRFALLRDRAMGSSAGVLAAFAAAYFGSMLVLPLNLQLIRGESATTTGLLMVPQALTTGIALQVASRATDRLPVRWIVPVGVGTSLLGYVGYALSAREDTPYVQIVAWSMVIGVGVGSTLMPTMTAAVRRLDGDDLASATTVLQIVNQLMLSVGAAMTSVLFALALTARSPGAPGVQQAVRLSEPERIRLAPQVADAFQLTMLLPVGLMAVALAVAIVFLPRSVSSPSSPRVSSPSSPRVSPSSNASGGG